MLTTDQKEKASSQLLELVQDFNEKLNAWSKETSCVVNFGWTYGGNDNQKSLQILGIDMIVYRKPPPQFETIKSALDKGVQEK